MDKEHQEVLERIINVMETGCEAVEHLVEIVKVEDQPIETSFSLALDTLEMLSEVQQALQVFHKQSWWDEISQSIQSVINLFGKLADAYEVGNKELYEKTINDIYQHYMDLYSRVVSNVINF